MTTAKKSLYFLIIVFLFFVPRAWPQTDADVLNQANALVRNAQTNQEFLEAAALFETLLRTRENAGLHYNLGNLYQRAGKPGPAVLHYLRALRLDPRNTETRHNLRLARKTREDRIPILQ